MTDSTALAQRFDLPSSTSSSYVWEVAQKPVSVQIPFDLIDRLEHDVIESFRSLSSRGSEIGGLLLGKVAPGTPMVVSVEDCELMPCEYSRGPLYRLGDTDLARVERAIEKYSGPRGLQAVGFFRSNTRKGLSLDAEDVSFFEARFHEPYHFSMLIRPSATKPSTAAIFIREAGKLGAESSCLEFPFRSSLLTPSRRGGDSNAPAGPKRPVEAEPEAILPKPAVRAQIVPIASWRETTQQPTPAVTASAPATGAEPEPPKASALPPAPVVAAAKAAPAPAAEPAAAAPKNVESAEARRSPSNVVAPEARRGSAEITSEITKPAETLQAAVVVKPAEAQASPVRIAAAAEMSALPESKRGPKVLGIAAGAAAAMVLLVLLFVFPGLLHRGKPGVPQQDISPLSLRVERSGTDILLTWNRDSAAIKNAAHASLSISDGERHENYDMDMGQLRNGSIVYSPVTADVSFKMAVTRQDQSKVSSESVRVLRTRPSPMPEEKATGQPGAQGAARSADPSQKSQPNGASQHTAAPTTEDDPKPQDATASVTAPPTRQFDAASLVTRLRPAAPTDLPEAPTMGTAGAAAGTSASALDLSAISAPPPTIAPPPPVKSGPAPVKTAPMVDVKATQVRTAEVLYKKDAEYPKLAKQTGATGIVELVATIGVDGKIKSVKISRGHPMLVKAAQDAVSQWIYKPAMLNGVAVESEAKISMRFGIDK